jgi:hypothetical protein
MIWLQLAAAWTAHAWWAALVVTAGLGILAWRTHEDWEALTYGFHVVLATILIPVPAALLPPVWAQRMHLVMLTCLALPAVASVLARAADYFVIQFLPTHFSDFRGRWVYVFPPLLWALSALGYLQGNWVAGYLIMVPATVGGARLAWRESDHSAKWKPRLFALLAAGGMAAWVLGPQLWPLPWRAWHWGTPLALPVLAQLAALVQHLWHAAKPYRNPDEEIRQQAVRRMTDQRRLAWVAKHDISVAVGVAAVERITDQALLADIARTREAWTIDAAVHHAAVERITDQTLLADLAKTKGDTRAAGRISDPALLVSLAEAAEAASVREAAVRGIDDQKVLFRSAKNDAFPEVRLAAVGRLSDQAMLAELARTSSDIAVRRAAIGKVTDQTVLGQVARNDASPELRKVAVEAVADPSLLAEIAKADSSSDVGKAAVARITDQELLADIANRGRDDKTRKAAFDRIHDPNMLAFLASSAFDQYMRAAAVDRVTDQALLVEIAKRDSQYVVRRSAADRITEEEGLAEVAKTAFGEILTLQHSALQRIRKPELLADVARTASKASVRAKALERVADLQVIEQAAKGDPDESVRRSAGERYLRWLAECHKAADPSARRDAAERLWRGIASMPRAKTAPYPLLAGFALADLPDALFEALDRGGKETRKIALKALVAQGSPTAKIESRIGHPGPRARQALAEIPGAGARIPRTLEARESFFWTWGIG